MVSRRGVMGEWERCDGLVGYSAFKKGKRSLCLLFIVAR